MERARGFASLPAGGDVAESQVHADNQGTRPRTMTVDALSSGPQSLDSFLKGEPPPPPGRVRGARLSDQPGCPHRQRLRTPVRLPSARPQSTTQQSVSSSAARASGALNTYVCN